MGYAPQVLREAGEELRRRRSAAQSEALEYSRRALSAVPDLDNMQRQLVRLAAEGAKAALFPEKFTPELLRQLEGESLALQRKMEQLLREHGFVPAKMEPQYTCPLCEDTGFVGQEICSCLLHLRQETAFRVLARETQLERFSFERFSLDYYSEKPDGQGFIPRKKMEKIFHLCKDYARSFTPHGESLLFLGHTGLGKTHLSLSIGRAVLEQGFGVLYLTAYHFVELADRFQFQKEQNPQDIALDAQACDLLILDDLGAEFSTNFSVAALQNLINYRLSAGKPTIVSTNLSVEQLEERYGERLKSRLLCAFQPVPFAGSDIRFRQRLESAAAT